MALLQILGRGFIPLSPQRQWRWEMMGVGCAQKIIEGFFAFFLSVSFV
jgi:hypothetical protein